MKKSVPKHKKIDTDIRRYLTHVERDLGIDIRKYIYIYFFSHEKERQYLIEDGKAASLPLQLPSQENPMKKICLLLAP